MDQWYRAESNTCDRENQVIKPCLETPQAPVSQSAHSPHFFVQTGPSQFRRPRSHANVLIPGVDEAEIKDHYDIAEEPHVAGQVEDEGQKAAVDDGSVEASVQTGEDDDYGEVSGKEMRLKDAGEEGEVSRGESPRLLIAVELDVAKFELKVSVGHFARSWGSNGCLTLACCFAFSSHLNPSTHGVASVKTSPHVA